MSTNLQKRTISVAPINLNPEEEAAIRDAFEALRPQVNREYTYSLTNNAALKEAEILIANLDTADFDRTNQLLKRVYGVRSTVFVAEYSGTQPQSRYKYIVPRDQLNDTLLKVLDEVSHDEFNAADSRPAVSAPASSASATPVKQNIAVKPDYIGRVLIVDDSPSVRTQMNLYLGKYKFECYTADNSEEALRAVKQIDFDMIFLDVIMPGVDGYQACKAIKSLLGTRQVPVILLTSKNSPVDKIHGIMSGCDKYLTKPVRSSELHSLLGSYFPKFKNMARTPS